LAAGPTRVLVRSFRGAIGGEGLLARDAALYEKQASCLREIGIAKFEEIAASQKLISRRGNNLRQIDSFVASGGMIVSTLPDFGVRGGFYKI